MKNTKLFVVSLVMLLVGSSSQAETSQITGKLAGSFYLNLAGLGIPLTTVSRDGKPDSYTVAVESLSCTKTSDVAVCGSVGSSDYRGLPLFPVDLPAAMGLFNSLKEFYTMQMGGSKPGIEARANYYVGKIKCELNYSTNSLSYLCDIEYYSPIL